jgi:hypothetical protein
LIGKNEVTTIPISVGFYFIWIIQSLSWKCPLRICPIFLISVMLLSCPRHVQEMSRDMSGGHTHVAALSGHQKFMMSCPDRTFQNMLLKVFKTLNMSSPVVTDDSSGHHQSSTWSSRSSVGCRQSSPGRDHGRHFVVSHHLFFEQEMKKLSVLWWYMRPARKKVPFLS